MNEIGKESGKNENEHDAQGETENARKTVNALQSSLTAAAQDVLRYMYAHRRSIPVISEAIAWERRHGAPFRWYDVRATTAELNRLVIDGILAKEGNRGYRLRDHGAAVSARDCYNLDMIESALARIGNGNGGSVLPPGADEGMFDGITGYAGAKRQIFMALGARPAVHVLLTGPPSTAKSLFLEGLGKLPGAKLTFGDAVSKAGLRRFVMDEHPQYLVIDEIDKMAPEDDTILLELMEHQTVSVMHFGIRRSEDISLTVFGAANDTRGMRRELLSRFLKIELREYSAEEFRKVAFLHLTRRMGVDGELAEAIAAGVSAKSRDIRDAVRIASMSRNMDDVKFLVAALGTASAV